MTTFVAVFSNTDPEQPSVFWGAFANFPDAHTAVGQWVEDHPYWEFEDFTIAEYPFGELL